MTGRLRVAGVRAEISRPLATDAVSWAAQASSFVRRGSRTVTPGCDSRDLLGRRDCHAGIGAGSRARQTSVRIRWSRSVTPHNPVSPLHELCRGKSRPGGRRSREGDRHSRRVRADSSCVAAVRRADRAIEPAVAPIRVPSAPIETRRRRSGIRRRRFTRRRRRFTTRRPRFTTGQPCAPFGRHDLRAVSRARDHVNPIGRRPPAAAVDVGSPVRDTRTCTRHVEDEPHFRPDARM